MSQIQAGVRLVQGCRPSEPKGDGEGDGDGEGEGEGEGEGRLRLRLRLSLTTAVVQHAVARIL